MEYQQCGKCCLGLDWTFTFKAENEDPQNPSEYILSRAKTKMNAYGLFYHRFKSAEKKDGYLSMTFKVGACQHLKYHNGKGHCTVHQERPTACKNYHCDTAKKITRS